MDALDILKVCLRRWYVMLPVVMMALGAGYALAKDQAPSYHARATFAFVYQSGSDVPGAADPRLANPLASNDLLGAALGYSLATPETQERLGAPTASGLPLGTPSNGTRFAFSGQSFTYGVDSWAPGPDAAKTTVENVMAAIPAEVERLQESAGAPRGSLSTIFVMSPTRVDVIPPGSGAKVLIAVGGAGVVTGAALSIAIDAILGRRARRGGGRRARSRDGQPSDPQDDDEPTQTRHREEPRVGQTAAPNPADAAQTAGERTGAVQQVADEPAREAAEELALEPAEAAMSAGEEVAEPDQAWVSRTDDSPEPQGTIIPLVGGHSARRAGSTRFKKLSG